jgi:hypothetical protein
VSETTTDAFAPAHDASPADWVLAGLHEFRAHDVSSIVPACFDHYARVFHPAELHKPAKASEGKRLPGGGVIRTYAVTQVSWATVAAANSRQMHPAAEWGSITGSLRYLNSGEQPGIWNQPPDQGNLIKIAPDLTNVLIRFTSTPQSCWFGIWDGYGMPLFENLMDAPHFGTHARTWRLLHGPIESAARSPFPNWPQSPNLWWPEDRAWCVGTDIDLVTTYVGGSNDCIEALLSNGFLEALPASVDQKVTGDADTINPLPPRESTRTSD